MQESNYDILGISEIASKKEIHEAFRRLALLHHADRGGNEEDIQTGIKFHGIWSTKHV